MSTCERLAVLRTLEAKDLSRMDFFPAHPGVLHGVKVVFIARKDLDKLEGILRTTKGGREAAEGNG